MDLDLVAFNCIRGRVLDPECGVGRRELTLQDIIGVRDGGEFYVAYDAIFIHGEGKNGRLENTVAGDRICSRPRGNIDGG